MKRTALTLLVLTFILAALGACAPAYEPMAQPHQLTDDLGRTVSLPAAALRIVSLAPSNTEILYAVGAGDQVIGRDEFSNYPPEVLDLPSVGGSMGAYNIEQIISLQPDLVLAAEINTPEQVKALEDAGITVYYLGNPTGLAGVYANLATAGTLTGHAQDAAALVEALKARVAAVEAKLAGVSERPTVFYELDGSDALKPWTAGPGTFIDLLIGMAGGQNAAADLGGAWGQLSLEALLVADPDFILLGDAAYGVTAELVAARAGWEGLKAVKNGRVLPFNDDWVSRPGPRLVDALEALAQVLHPEVFD